MKKIVTIVGLISLNFLYGQDDDLLKQAIEINIQAQIEHMRASINSYSVNNYKDSFSCPKSLEDLIDENYISKIPTITLNDNEWKGEGKNTYKIDPTTNTLITEDDIDETTAWIYNNVFGDIKINKKGLLEANDFFNTYFEMVTNNKYKINIDEKIKYAKRATKLLKLEKMKTRETVRLYLKEANDMLNKKQVDKAVERYLTALKVIEDFNNKLINLYKTKISLYINKKEYNKANYEYQSLIESITK